MNYYNASGQMDLSDRIAIETGICIGESFKKIAKRLRRHPSTIAHEVKENRTFIKGNYPNGKDCRMARQCTVRNLCGCDEEACNTKCRLCRGVDCTKVCDRYVSVACHKFDSPPYVCNNCKDRNMFDILEGDFVDSVVYDAKKLEYEHVRNAYKGYIEEFKTHNHTYYEFKKVDNSVDYKKEYEVRKNNFTEYFQSNSDVFLESLKEINNYKQKLSNYFANGINDNISTIVTSFNRMLDEVVVQKYLFSKLFELPSEYSVVIDETIRLLNVKLRQ